MESPSNSRETSTFRLFTAARSWDLTLSTLMFTPCGRFEVKCLAMSTKSGATKATQQNAALIHGLALGRRIGPRKIGEVRGKGLL
jgi:hypothetical protein